MNFNQQVQPIQIESQKSLNSPHQIFKNSNKKLIPKTTLLSKHPFITNRVYTIDEFQNKEKILDLKHSRTPIIKQFSLDTDPQQFQGKRLQSQKISNDIEKTQFLQIQTARNIRTSQIDKNNTIKIPEAHQISEKQKNNNYFKSESICNEKILDLLLLNTQELKGFFQNEKEPLLQQKAKPRIKNIKGFPSDFFSVI
ncbi:unnamed protein product [Paramecium sonneborni]|uniref:Uncharacterized protein n=1 Tax=Paramecium sonneborni TaxID=65129 RepID=A0A8S1M2C2_9CILI|nr:unnamed protein product [Paramecium sonneborni]